MKNWYKLLLYILNAIIYLVIIALWLSIPDEFMLNIAVSVFNLVLSMVLVIWDRAKYKRLYESSWFNGFVATIIQLFIIFCIIGLVNYLAFKNPIQFDSSRDEINSLTDVTRKVLGNFDKKLKFTVFDRKSELPLITTILELYRYQNSNIEIQTVDLELRPDLVKENNVTQAGTVIVEYNNRKERVVERSELAYTNALIRLIRTRDPRVVFSTGHGELDLLKKDKDGISMLRGILEQSLYQILPANLAIVETVPDDIDAIVILGPREGFLDREIALLDDYLKRGGNLLVALDPDLNKKSPGKLRQLISKYGLVINNDLVVDRIEHVSGSNGSVPLIKKFDKEHIITRSFEGPMFFPLVSSVSKAKENRERRLFTALASSSIFPASWAERNFAEIGAGTVEYSKGVDVEGPITVMASMDDKATGSRIVGIGNSTFVINGYGNYSKNFSLFVNSLAWLTSEDQLTSFNLPAGKDEPVFIGAPQLGIIFYFSVIFAPLLLFASAVYFYRRRRKL